VALAAADRNLPMSQPAQIDGLENARLPAKPLHLAIGMFDGVHLGHRAVVKSAVQAARTEGGVSAVLTFWPHPSALFRPENPTRLMQDAATKSRLLLALGVDVVITQSFTPELAAMPAGQFLPWLRRNLPRLAAVYVGENFRFGCERRGDVALLKQTGAREGVQVFSAPPVAANDDPVSSTRIRALLVEGKIEAANSMLGYPYFVEGTVLAGKRLGRTIGFPTLNVPWSPGLRPRFGVYAVRVSGDKASTRIPGVANYGLRPTVEHVTEPLLETHLIGDSPFDAGDQIKVELLHFLRPEKKFSGLEELRAQIAQDRIAAETILR
jgi:riboflavin kinase/FMN adenylyltransferase